MRLTPSMFMSSTQQKRNSASPTRFSGAFKDQEKAQQHSTDGKVDSFEFGKAGTIYVVNSQGKAGDYEGGNDYDKFQTAKAQGGEKLKQVRTKLWTLAVINES